MPAPQCSIHLLPEVYASLSSLKSHATLLRSFRLASLSANPEAFGTPYEIASQLPLSDWETKLQTSSASHIIATWHLPLQETTAKNTGGREIEDEVTTREEWVAMVVLVGPVPAPTNAPGMVEWAINPLASSPNTPIGRFWIEGVFTLPTARGKGICTALLGRAVEIAADIGGQEGAEKVVVEIRVGIANEHAARVYKAAGFAFVGSGETEDRKWKLMEKSVDIGKRS
ncbi:MAG: hypothetical protein M1829_004266 [Trizodia sp. TS-e1964]|nr:MAG: hypothetical protein M1829_004266 [Trizodia sp. TS-e1964]